MEKDEFIPNYPGQEKYFKGCAKKCLFIALVPTQGTLFNMQKTRTNNFIKLFSMVNGSLYAIQIVNLCCLELFKRRKPSKWSLTASFSFSPFFPSVSLNLKHILNPFEKHYSYMKLCQKYATKLVPLIFF